MSNLCKTQLCNTVVNQAGSVTSAASVDDILFTTIAIDKTTQVRSSTIDVNELPDLNTTDIPNGHIAFLKNTSVPVIASNCSWIGLDGRALGTFIENRVLSWGEGSQGQLGIGINCNTGIPTRESSVSSNWCSVGSRHGTTSSAIKLDGSLWVWGGPGTIGDGTGNYQTRFSPVREFCSATDWCCVSTSGYGGVGVNAGLKTTGEIWTWGSSVCGQLGDGTTVRKCSPVREISSSTNWCFLSTSIRNVGAIKTDGSLWMWGNNFYSQLGIGFGLNTRSSPVREATSSTNWLSVRPATNHTIGLKSDGTIWSWGCNCFGVLGIGNTTCRISATREFCSATNWCNINSGSYNTSFAIKTDGSLWSWGSNNFGVLGDGTTTCRCSPVREFSSSTDWCCASAADNFTTAIKTTGTLWSWGSNAGGRLGIGSTLNTFQFCSPVREFSSSVDWVSASNGRNSVTGLTNTVVVCR